jgi:hypothetical protein
MDRVVNIKTYQSPTLWVEIDDLRIPCAVPTLDEVERFLAKAEAVTRFTGGKLTQEGYDQTFGLLAEIVSCNHNFVEYSPAELKKKNITVTQIMGILTDWVRFIGDLSELKN